MSDPLNQVLLAMGFSEPTVTRLREQYSVAHIHTHMRQTLWLVGQGKVVNPTGWMIASLRENFSPPYGYPAELTTHTMTIQLDERTFAEVEQIVTNGNAENETITEFRKRMLARGTRVG